MPLVKAGGSITMYIPPSLAYGNNDQRDQLGNIILPANSYIKFEMSLKAVQ
jgi:FKBP-type peptidyl-prolyl cis-trans isomerase FkpA